MVTITICTIAFLIGAVFGEYTNTYTFAEYAGNFIDIAKLAMAGVAATTILAIITQKA